MEIILRNTWRHKLLGWLRLDACWPTHTPRLVARAAVSSFACDTLRRQLSVLDLADFPLPCLAPNLQRWLSIPARSKKRCAATPSPPPCSPAPQPLAPPALGQPLKLLGAQAKKTLQSASGGFSFFSNKEVKLQNAAELDLPAANAYRVEKLSEGPSPRADDPPPPAR